MLCMTELQEVSSEEAEQPGNSQHIELQDFFAFCDVLGPVPNSS